MPKTNDDGGVRARVVSFRLDTEMGSRLEEEAAFAGTSVGEIARSIVVAALNGSPTVAAPNRETGPAVPVGSAAVPDPVAKTVESDQELTALRQLVEALGDDITKLEGVRTSNQSLLQRLEQAAEKIIGAAARDLEADRKTAAARENAADSLKALEQGLRAINTQTSRLEQGQHRQSVRFSDAVQMLLVSAGELTVDEAREYARRYLIDPKDPVVKPTPSSSPAATSKPVSPAPGASVASAKAAPRKIESTKPSPSSRWSTPVPTSANPSRTAPPASKPNRPTVIGPPDPAQRAARLRDQLVVDGIDTNVGFEEMVLAAYNELQRLEAARSGRSTPTPAASLDGISKDVLVYVLDLVKGSLASRRATAPRSPNGGTKENRIP